MRSSGSSKRLNPRKNGRDLIRKNPPLHILTILKIYKISIGINDGNFNRGSRKSVMVKRLVIP